MELSIKAVLNEAAKEKLNMKTKRNFHGGKPNGEETEYYIGRTRVGISQGIVQAEVPVHGPMSEEIVPYIVLYKAEGFIDTRIIGERHLGKYTLPSDKEVVCLVNPYNGLVHKFVIYGSDRDKVFELYGLIRDGKIMPDEEFGGIQGGKSRKELECEVRFLSEHKTGLETEMQMLQSEVEQARATLQEAQQLVDHKSGQIEGLQNELKELRERLELSEATFRTHQEDFNRTCEKNVRVRQLTNELLGKSDDGSIFFWPLVSRRGVVEKITTILDDTK